MNNQVGKAPMLNGNFEIWKARMNNFLMAQGFKVWESMVTGSTIEEEESNVHNSIALKEILSGLPNPIKTKLEKCSSAKDMWDKLQDLHSKGALTMTSNKEDDGKQERNPEPIKEAENKNEDIKARENLEDEENEEDLQEDLKAKLEVALKQIRKLNKENKELKEQVQDGDYDFDKTRKEVDLFKLQVQERDEELTKIKEEFHQNKKRHHEEVISMTNQLDKGKKREYTLSSHLEQSHKDLNKLEVKIGQYKEEVFSLKSQLEEAKKQAQGGEKVMEALALLEGQVDEAEK